MTFDLYSLAIVSTSFAAAMGIASVTISSSSVASRRIVSWAGWVAVLATLAAFVERWWTAGHLPLFGTYESAISLAAFSLLVGVLVEVLQGRKGRILPLMALPAAILLIHGRSYDPTPYALTISERSFWVDLHSIVAWAAFGILALNAVFAARLLIPGTRARSPEDRWLERSISWGFLFHSAMIATGSFYKFLIFGTMWTFDPIETMAFTVWLAYGLLLHMHLFSGWRGRRLAQWCLGVFVLLVISYRGIVYFPSFSTYHIFDMDLRMHLTGAESQELER